MSADPLLERLKTEQLTTEELQAALVKMLDLHIALSAKIYSLERSGRILGPEAAMKNFHYGF